MDWSQCAVVSVGVGQWYPRGIERLSASLDTVGYRGQRFIGTDYPPRSPTHQECNYAFKARALELAANRARYLLWLDASCWAVKPIDPIFDQIIGNGSFWQVDGWNTGQWTSDAALPILGITREEAFSIPHLWTCAFGLDARRHGDVLAEFIELVKAGATHGPWTNRNGEVSSDPRVLGHRHEQTVLSVLVHKMQLPTVPVTASPVRAACQPVPLNVCVLAQGM